MKKILNISVLLVSAVAVASQVPVAYQYWIDADKEAAKSDRVSGMSFRFEVDAGSMSPGGHTISYRLLDDEGHWGAAMNMPFYIPVDAPAPKSPIGYQYWFDNDFASAVTLPYSEAGLSLSLDMSGLAPGGHHLNYRLAGEGNAWGTIYLKPFYVPLEKDLSSATPVAYREYIDNKLIRTGSLTAADATLTLTMDVADDIEVTNVEKRNFSYVSKYVQMDIEGRFNYAFQILSDAGEWGAPLCYEFRKSYKATEKPDSVGIPNDYTFAKVDNNHFKAYRFCNPENKKMYFKTSQDCRMSLYYVSGDSFGRIRDFSVEELRGTVECQESRTEYVAILYDMPVNEKNPEEEIQFRVMFGDNKLPPPEIILDEENNLLTMTNDDARAIIHYTLDGSQPTPESPVYSTPIKLEKNLTVKAYAVLDGLGDSDVVTRYITTLKLPRPELINVEGSTFTFAETVNGARTYYTLDGTNPDVSVDTRIEFDGNPFTISNDCTVKAYSTKEGLLDSEIAVFDVDLSAYFTSPPSFGRDGDDKLRISAPEEAKVYYRQYVKGDVAGEWVEYNGTPFDVVGNMYVEAYAKAEDKAASEIVTEYIDWVKAAMPTYENNNYRLKLFNSTPGGRIYYYMYYDSTVKEYVADSIPDGIDTKDQYELHAYVEAEGYAKSEELRFNVNEHTLSQPEILFVDGVVEITHPDSTVTIVPTFTPEQDYEVVAPNHIKCAVAYNSTVEAYVEKEGYNNSDIVTLDKAEKPEITNDLFTVTIRSGHQADIYYTLDGSMPTESSMRYTVPFDITESVTVRAVAFVENLIPSEADRLFVEYREAPTPTFGEYDGRYLPINNPDSEATVYYAIGDGKDPIADGNELLDNKVDMEGLNTIRVVATKESAVNSDVVEYSVDYYANETDVYTKAPGLIKNVFGWCNGDLSGIESLKVHGTLCNGNVGDRDDYAFLMTLPELRHIDLSDVPDNVLPDSALASDKLLSVVLPVNLESVGKAVFGENNSTLCAVEIPVNNDAPASLLDSVVNPNILLYVVNDNNAVPLKNVPNSILRNVIVLDTKGGIAESDEVILSHGSAFYAPKEFTAKKISYTREFTKETPIGGDYGSGWETLSVPFDVQAVDNGGSALQPFGIADMTSGVKPYWLFEGDGSNWSATDAISANTPYLISFPNNPLYADEYNVRGQVTFSATGAFVDKTPSESEMMYGFGSEGLIVGNYSMVSKEENVLAINEETYNYIGQDFLPGGIFVSGQKDVPPFECYVVSDSGAREIPIFDTSDMDMLMGESGCRIWSEGHDIYIRSGLGMRVRIFDVTGQLLRIVDVKAGETTRVEDFNAGIYIVGHTKIYIKG